MGSSEGSIRKLDTSKMHSAILSFESGIKEYNDIKTKVELTTTELFLHWQGKGKTQFEKDYTTIYRQLTDIEDILYELYNALIDGESTYVSVDQEISKRMTP
jgi:uncharacterized protein YukE